MLVIACGCLIAMITYGVRTSFGLFTEPLSEGRGWGREVFALSIAIQNLLWGLAQPAAGAFADRYGSARVLAAGGAVYALGVGLMAVSGTPLAIQLTGGVLVGLGLSGGSFTIVIAALGRLVSEDRRSWAMGLATASGSFGQFLFAPLGQAFISSYGWQSALVLLAAGTIFVPVLAVALRSDGGSSGAAGEPAIPMREAIRTAFGHGSYLLLVAGFFVCGFHVAFITTHLPAHLSDAAAQSHAHGTHAAGAAQLGAWALAIIGLANIVGSYTAGILGGRKSKRKLLSGIYLARAAVITFFVTLPPTTVVVVAFAALMGVLWLSTVPLTSGLVAVMFGTRHLGALFGFVFLSHQVGAFLGVWLGGIAYEATGSYDPMWWAGVGLALIAAALHCPIVER
ncbi:MAG: MFS transporter, partial [Actinomycetota bacterium]|nr:MFS transporter [Actinomycetota bacterium]